MSQLDLTGRELPVGVKLTRRQDAALEHIRANGPIADDDLGAYIHAWQGRHPADRRCRFCGDAGRELGVALRRKGLTRERRGAGWYVPGSERTVSDVDRGEIPF